MIVAIARRELGALFSSPQAWIFLALSQLVLAWSFLGLVDQYQTQLQPQLVKLNSSYGVTDLVVARFLGSPLLLLLLLLAAALMAMRVLAEERRQGTLPLLLSAPVSSSEIVLGKFLAAWGFGLALLAVWALMPLSLLLGTGIDLGRLLAALLGLALLTGAFMALAIWLSGTTGQPGLAAVATFIAGLLLMLVQHGAAAAGEGESVFAYLSVLSHVEGFLTGRVATADLAYFLLLSAGLVALAIRRLDALRVQP